MKVEKINSPASTTAEIEKTDEEVENLSVDEQRINQINKYLSEICKNRIKRTKNGSEYLVGETGQPISDRAYRTIGKVDDFIIAQADERVGDVVAKDSRENLVILDPQTGEEIGRGFTGIKELEHLKVASGFCPSNHGVSRCEWVISEDTGIRRTGDHDTLSIRGNYLVGIDHANGLKAKTIYDKNTLKILGKDSLQGSDQKRFEIMDDILTLNGRPYNPRSEKISENRRFEHITTLELDGLDIKIASTRYGDAGDWIVNELGQPITDVYQSIDVVNGELVGTLRFHGGTEVIDREKIKKMLLSSQTDELKQERTQNAANDDKPPVQRAA